MQNTPSEGKQNTPSEGKQNTPIDRRTRSHSGTPSDRVTRIRVKVKSDGDDVPSKKRKVHADKKCSSSSDLKLVFGNISPTNDEQTRLQLHDFVPVCEDKNEIHIESGVVAEVKTNAKKHSKNKPKSQSINNENPDPLPSNLNSSETELKLLRSEIKKVNDKVSSLENLMISSFEKVFKALGERDASKGNRKDDDHHDKNVSENNFGSEEVMEKNIGIEEVVKKNVDNEVSLEQTVDVMEGVVKDSIQDGKSSEGVGDDEAWIEDAEPEITAITQQFCDKNTANMGSLVDDSVQLGKNSCEEVGEDNSWSSDAEAQITAITQKYFNQNIEHGDLGVEKNIATMQEDRIVVDHDTPEMNPRERKPAGVMKSPFMNTFDSGGTIQVVENKPTKSKKPILTIKYPFQGNIDNPVDFKVLCRLKDQTKKDKKKKSKSHSVVDDKSLKDNKKKGKTHAVCDDKTLKDIKKNSKLHDVGDDETLKDIKKKGKLKGKMK
ncbi:hypothetical protein A4A49_43705 [Nicotiana attenuata]|uniref:Uncharacterized protein n=1 Tax=Nicotiana attenuata TaxID=49451 RepID=A0A314LFI2_NICAT|nr:hypothetical protein A4A49_43705 [Nicotiana attenuata]